MKVRISSTLALILVFSASWVLVVAASSQGGNERRAQSEPTPPNVLIFLVDDLGWNQVGYHANPVGNNEIQTPHIDAAAGAGIELNRGYVTPWCGPSRAAIMTGRTNVYNANVSQVISTFDDDIGFVAGLPVGTISIAHAFKEYGASIGHNYTAFYDGKWGIGGTAWANTPLGMGFDNFRGSWGTGLETCDGVVPSVSVVAPFKAFPFQPNIGPLMIQALPGYWEQKPDGPDSDMCPYIKSIPAEKLTTAEKEIACKTIPRTPPKIVDLDLLDKVVDQIKTHDYENTGPFVQVFSTVMLHLPMAYPAEYNEAEANRNYTNGMPSYFAADKIKNPATIDDNRWATNKGVAFVDDIFGRTVQAIKDAGQWNNTIVYFTSDNGGVVYHGTANNNYPLRASKFSPFEGGIRTPQFISGGWIDKNLPEGRLRQSNTYIFPNDIAPTLLGMAGGDVSFLLGEKKGAPYGNQMWEYIKTSVDPTTRKETHQKVRKVSYAPDFFFDVQTNRTMKFVFTGDKPVNVPRLYEPIWPKNGDLIMDTTYKSIKPCRPDGVASDCCIWDIHEDWQERNPLATDCSAMHLEAKNLFAMDGGCPKDSNGRHLNHACLESGDVNGKVPERYLSLWTHYGASGPFTNSKGQPMNGLPMKCICYGLEIGSKASNVDYFVVRNLGPSQCGKSRGLFRKMRPLMSIPCDGSFALQTPPQKDILTQYVEEGFDASSFRKILRLEKNKLIISDVASVFELLITFMKRKGKKDWPSLNKFPFNGDMDTCKEKGVVPVPFPVVSITPYMFGTRDPTNAADLPLIGLCAAYSLTQFFCPSHQNALLKPVIEWTNDELGRPYGVFSDGTHWKPMGLDECSRKCKMEPEGTAYIGEGPYGLTV